MKVGGGGHLTDRESPGAVAVIGSDGWLGIKPSEMEWLGEGEST
jgi:hypothetical protein